MAPKARDSARPSPVSAASTPKASIGKTRKTKERSLLTQQGFGSVETSINVGRPKQSTVPRESVLVRPTKRTEFLKKKADQEERDARRVLEKAEKGNMANLKASRGWKPADGVKSRKRSAEEAALQQSGMQGKKRGMMWNGSDWAGRPVSIVTAMQSSQGIVERGDPNREMTSKKQVLFLTDLPKELRNQIWRRAVVTDTTFTFPTGEYGKEQPDLAMVSRLVRKEVLEVFYDENTFAIDVSDESKDLGLGISSRSEPERGKTNKIAKKQMPIMAWANAIQDGGWIGKIRRWSFMYKMDPTQTDGAGLVVSLVFTKRQERMWGADVQIHGTASCVLTGYADAAKCAVSNTPVWLNESVISLLDSAKAMGRIEGSLVVVLAVSIRAGTAKLMDLRCTLVRGSEDSIAKARREGGLRDRTGSKI